MTVSTVRRASLLALAALLAGCSATGVASRSARSGSTKVTIKPSSLGRERVHEQPDGLAPIDKPPSGFTKVSGDGFVAWAPPGFTPKKGTSRSGEPLLVLVGPGAEAARPHVGFGRDTKPGRASVMEQSYTFESALRVPAPEPAKGIRRTVTRWPGTLRAVIVEWTTEAPDASGATSAMHHVQLFTDVDDGLSLSVVAAAPVDTFDQSQVATVLRTFRPT
ncbi:MAG TPA: hypothetical protein VFJ85_14520 [Acidimicrobiales bacterium]|nr:hypothetical protein [Acidimicrobiales bacterium]